MNSDQKTYLIQGNKAFREKKYDLALELYKKALKTSPELEKLIQANIVLTERKITTAKGSPEVDYSNRIIKIAAEQAEQQPDFFSIKSTPASAELLVFAWIESHSDVIKTLQIAQKLQTKFECLVLAPKELFDSIVVSILPHHCESFQLVCFPSKTRKSGAFIRTLNAGVFAKYSDLLWIDPSQGISFDVDQIEKLNSNQLNDIGIIANSLTTCGQIRSAFRDRYLGSWLARLHRANNNKNIAVPQGSFCIKTLILNQISAMNINPVKFDSVTPSIDRDAFDTLTAVIGITAHEGMFTAADSTKVKSLFSYLPAETNKSRTVKTIAFYLPQFHPIPENDLWWGKGFTEWNNVIRAKPLFRSHYQPKLPANLGFYDLRSESAQVAQAELATSFGVHGFCYYYYWFNGKKLLNQPIENMLSSGKPDFPFCVCWANENWSRNWDGQNKHVLMEQQYSKESNTALIHEFIKMMKDSRYIRHNGKPVLLVYRIKIIPNWLETAEIWREECRKAGVGEIHLCSIRFGLEPLEGMPAQHGLDSYVLFPPQDMSFVDAKPNVQDLNSGFGGTMYSYDEVVDADVSRFRPGYQWPVHRGAMLGWDNTARRLTSARVFVGCTPMRYRSWVKQILEQEDRHNPNNESLLFINAWNEWAEGTTLEPDQKFGTGYLEATSSVISAYNGIKNTSNTTMSSLEQTPKNIKYIKSFSPPRLPDYWQGEATLNKDQPTVLLCAHISGHQLFGGERSFLDVMKTLKRLGFNIIVSLPSSNNKNYIAMVCEHAHAIYSFPYAQWTLNREADSRLTLQFADIIAKHNISIVYSNTIVLVEPAAAARKMGRISITHIRELITLDDSLRERIGLPIQDIIKSVFERYDFGIANSAATEKVFSRMNKTFYAPNAVDYREISTPNVISQKIKFGIVSSNIPKKGISDFIEVAVICQDLINEAEFVIVGPDNPHTAIWKNEIASGKLPNNIKFVGYRESPRQAIAEINVLLNLSQFAESFGRTVAEAMAAKRPVIAYEWGALPELVLHEKNGYLAPFGDVNSVANYVRKIVTDRRLINKLGSCGFKYITNNFSHDALFNKLSAAFSSIKKSIEWESITSQGYDKSQTNQTSIIIPVYNAAEEVRNCLDSVLAHTPRDVEIIVINDGSTDLSISGLLAEYDGKGSIRVLHNDGNKGYTQTVNRGISETGSNDVILLNSDTVVTPYWLQAMRASAYAEPRIGTVTAMSDNAGAFSFPQQGVANPKPEYLTHEEYATYVVDNTFGCEFVDVPTGSGFCFYIRRVLINEIGSFDKELFPRGYGEENDFCMRANVGGWKNVITPWAFVYHVRTASFKGEKDKLVKSGVDVVTRKYPDYSEKVRTAFSSQQMKQLRKLSDIRNDLVANDNNI